MKPSSLIIGIAGGSGSGKTSLVQTFQKTAPWTTTRLTQDLYYHDLSHLAMPDREKINFDHPQSLDFDRMAEDIKQLSMGHTIHAPGYDFYTHTRFGEQVLCPADLLLVEGTLILSMESMRRLFSLSVFVDVPDDVRKQRRLDRDMAERGRTRHFAEAQYEHTVKPMYEKWIAPAIRHADLILEGTRPLPELAKQLEETVKKKRSFLFKEKG